MAGERELGEGCEPESPVAAPSIWTPSASRDRRDFVGTEDCEKGVVVLALALAADDSVREADGTELEGAGGFWSAERATYVSMHLAVEMLAVWAKDPNVPNTYQQWSPRIRPDDQDGRACLRLEQRPWTRCTPGAGSRPWLPQELPIRGWGRIHLRRESHCYPVSCVSC